MENRVERIEEQWNKKELRKNTNKLARGVFIYELIMFLIVIIDFVRRIVPIYSGNNEPDIDSVMDKTLSKAASSGTSSVIAVFIGLLFLLFYFRKCDYRKFIFNSKEKMTGSAFLILLAVFMSVQAVFSILSVGTEACLNSIGFSIMGEINSATSKSITVSMLLYASFIGPIAEEIIFRGFVMRGFQKYGTYYSIFMSAVIFGAFHGNLLQGIFATMVGLILGYVAMKYSIKWAVILHIINNFIFGDLLFYLTANMNESMQSVVMYIIEGVFVAGTIVIMVLKRDKIEKFIKDRKIDIGLLGVTYTSVWLIIFLAFQLLLGISGIEKLPS